MPLERIKPRGPLRSIRLQPCVELHQRFRTKSVDPPLGIASDLHQPGVAQHLEVTRYTRLMHPDLLNQLVHRPLAFADRVKDPPPCRFSDHLEDIQRSVHVPEYMPIPYIRASECKDLTVVLTSAGER